MAETERRQDYIKSHFRGGKVRVKFHSPKTSFLEGVLARGDERLAEVIQRAFSEGARFDGWDEHLQFDVWMQAFQDCGVNPDEYLKPRMIRDPLPWDMVDTGIDREYLLSEWENAQSEIVTPDCRHGDCHGCGVCDFLEVYPRIASHEFPAANHVPETTGSEDKPRRFRLRYAKTGRARFFGHQDIIRCFHRAFRRIGLRLDYSKGFHPHPKLRFSPPLAVGVESIAEYMDFDLLNCSWSEQAILDALWDALPAGIDPRELWEIPFNGAPVSARIQQVTYEVTDLDSVPTSAVARKVQEFLQAPVVELCRNVEGKTTKRNLKEWVTDIEFLPDALRMTLRCTPSGSVHPLDTLATILSATRDDVKHMRIVKKSVRFSSD
jgi:radical SAM-linked protein